MASRFDLAAIQSRLALPAIPRRLALPAILIFGLTLVPLAAGIYQTYLIELAMLNVIVAIGLNLLTGNCGQISLCHASFMAIGAYTTALLMTRAGLSYLVALPLGTVTAALLGAGLGFPARRLSGLYLALVTLGFLEIVQITIEEFPDLTGGIRGLSVSRPYVLGFHLKSDASVYYFVLAMTVSAVVVGANLQRSRFGRAFDAIRQNTFAAQSLGIPLGQIKLLAFSVAAGFAGLAGGMFTIVVGFIDPTEFGISASLRHITFIVVGGLGSIVGSILGAVALTALPEFLRGAKEYSDLVYGGILLGTLLFMPRGLKGLWDTLANLDWTRVRTRS
jgi:branched-chain amino acid transport system permease protein